MNTAKGARVFLGAGMRGEWAPAGGQFPEDVAGFARVFEWAAPVEVGE